MSSRLDSISDWIALAQRAEFRVAAIAKACGVTDRQLRRYFQARFNCSPHTWAAAKRLEMEKRLLSNGKLIKEVASEAGFHHQSSLARQMQRDCHVTPSQLRLKQNKMSD